MSAREAERRPMGTDGGNSAMDYEANPTRSPGAEMSIYRSMPGKAQKTWWREESVTNWDEFVEWLRAGGEGGKTGRPYIPALFEDPKRTRRQGAFLVGRYAITLDADTAGPDYLAQLDKVLDVRAISHTTASHTPGHPRWRTIIPASRLMTPSESLSIATYYVNLIGPERFDVTASTSPMAVAYAPTEKVCEFAVHDGVTR